VDDVGTRIPTTDSSTTDRGWPPVRQTGARAHHPGPATRQRPADPGPAAAGTGRCPGAPAALARAKGSASCPRCETPPRRARSRGTGPPRRAGSADAVGDGVATCTSRARPTSARDKSSWLRRVRPTLPFHDERHPRSASRVDHSAAGHPTSRASGPARPRRRRSRSCRALHRGWCFRCGPPPSRKGLSVAALVPAGEHRPLHAAPLQSVSHTRRSPIRAAQPSRRRNAGAPRRSRW